MKNTKLMTMIAILGTSITILTACGNSIDSDTTQNIQEDANEFQEDVRDELDDEDAQVDINITTENEDTIEDLREERMKEDENEIDVTISSDTTADVNATY
jgi:uncharacterized membrane protein (DUF106 family)